MLRIQRALLKETLVVFLMIASLVTFAVFLGSTIRLLSDGGDMLGADLIAALLPKLIPVAFGFAAPFSWLAAVALVTGRWSADHELTIVRTAGWPMRTLAVPVLALSALLAVGGMAFHAYYVPVSHRAVQSTMKDYLPKFLASLQGTNRSIVMKHGHFSFGGFRDGAFYNVELERRAPRGELMLKVLAKRMRLSQVYVGDDDRGIRFVVESGLFIVPRGGDTSVREVRSPETINMGAVQRTGVTASFEHLSGLRRWRYRAKDMTADELLYYEHRVLPERRRKEKPLLALHGRLALGASIFFLGLFALAMAFAIPPSGRRVRDSLLCILPAIGIFAPLYVAGPSFTKRFHLEPWLAMWLPNIIIGMAALIVFWLGRRR